MTSLIDLKNAIDTLLSVTSSGSSFQPNFNKSEKAFEAYVFSLCSKAIQNLGGIATLTGVQSGANPNRIIFRSGPGNIWSSGKDFCYLDCEFSNKEFEVHLDVTYEGNSGAHHELDISLYSKKDLVKVRQYRIFPKMQKPLIGAIECKFYTTTPGVLLGRTYVGLLKDALGRQRFDAFVSNQSSEGLRKFLSNKSLQSFVDLSPLDKTSEERFIKNLEQFLLKWSHTK